MKTNRFFRSACRGLILTFLLSCLTGTVTPAQTKPANKEKKDSLSAYEKLFHKAETHRIARGWIQLHLVDGKLYLEIPDSLLYRPLLIYSFAEQVSHPGYAFLGRRVGGELKVCFTRTDSLLNLCRYETASMSEDSNIEAALRLSEARAILFSFPIAALSPDGTARVCDATDLIINDDVRISNLSSIRSMGPFQSVKKANFSRENSYIEQVIAYPDHAEVISTRSYTFETNDASFDEGPHPVSIVARTFLSPMPRTPMQARLADPRAGTEIVTVNTFSALGGSKKQDYAQRWRLEPSDPKAFLRGEKVEPLQKIVFYIDTLFTAPWQEGIRSGVEKWNAAFEAIGFKNVIEALPYPKDDAQFSAANYRYNCIKYNQNEERDITVRRTVDYRTGEILSASIGVPRDCEFMVLQPQSLITTGAYEASVRGIDLPPEVLKEIVQSHFMRAAGRCLGLKLNYAAATVYTPEQLRDPGFTAANGFASSVMTPENYNYLVQPSDYQKGAKVRLCELGPYDYYIIKWLYTPIEGSPEEVAKTTTQWICDHSGDARYKYAPVQPYRLLMDPRYAASALSTDPIAAFFLRVNNLKYVAAHAGRWIDVPGADETYKKLLPDFIYLQAFAITPVLAYLGGYTLHNPIDTPQKPGYEAIPMDKQKEALQTLLDYTHDLSWIDNPHLIRCSGLNDNISKHLTATLVTTVMQRIAGIPALMQTAQDRHPTAYCELNDYLCDYILPKVASGKKLDYAQMLWFDNLCRLTRLSLLFKPQYEGDRITAFRDCREMSAREGIGFSDTPRPLEDTVAEAGLAELPSAVAQGALYDPFKGIRFFSAPALSAYRYKVLQRIVKAAGRGARRSRDTEQKALYRQTVLTLNKLMAGE